MELILLIVGFFAISIGRCTKVTKQLYNDRNFTRQMSEKIFGQNPDRNFVWSPLSLEMALAAVMMGAKDATFDQLLEHVFKAPDRHYYMTDLVSSLKETSTMYKSKEATLNYATILALDDSLRLKEHYRKTLANFYSNPTLLRVNFAEHGKMAAASINAMVSEATINRITDLIPANSLNSQTAMVLVNAVYFNAEFQEKFERTTNDTFYALNGLKFENVEFLTRSFSSLPYYEKGDVQMINLPFIKSKFNLYVAMNKTMRSASTQEKKRNMRKLMKIVLGGVMNNKFRYKSVEVKLPKFKIEYTAEKLVEKFKSLGVRDLFNGSVANFEQLLENRRQKVAVSNIRHKAFIEDTVLHSMVVHAVPI